jgi:hypothetical protein
MVVEIVATTTLTNIETTTATGVVGGPPQIATHASGWDIAITIGERTVDMTEMIETGIGRTTVIVTATVSESLTATAKPENGLLSTGITGTGSSGSTDSIRIKNGQPATSRFGISGTGIVSSSLIATAK